MQEKQRFKEKMKEYEIIEELQNLANATCLMANEREDQK